MLDYYPQIGNDVSLHLTPTDGIVRFRNSDQLYTGDQYSALRDGMEYINNSATRMLQMSDGESTIKEIIEAVYGPENIKKCKKPVSDFFTHAARKRHVILTKSKGARKAPRTTGSYDYYVPVHISVEVTGRCNLKCVYCYNDHAEVSDGLPPDELLRILEKWRTHGLLGVEITGGEPFLYRGIWELIDYCASSFGRIALLSNGTLITGEHARRLSRYKDKMIISISIDGSCPEIHDKLRGKGSFRKSTAAVRALCQNGLGVRVGMTNHPDNIWDLENTIKMAKSLGAKYFSWGPIAPFGRGEEIAWNWDAQKAMDIARMEAKMVKKYKGFVTVVPESAMKLFEKIGNCGFGFKNLVVSPNGKVRPCLYLPETDSIADLTQESLEDLFRKPIMHFFRELKVPSREVCKKCRYFAYCGACISRPLKAIEREGRLCVWAHDHQIAKWLPRFQQYEFNPEKPVFKWTKSSQ